VWDAFIEKYPSGFFTALAKAQRDKLAAEAARIEATSRAKAAQDEQARLAVEGAKAAEQARAAEQAKAAEKARIAAELAKKAEEAKVAEAERAKAAAEAKLAEAERAKAVKVAEEAKAAEAARLKAAEVEKDPAAKRGSESKIAALTPPADQSDQPKAVDLPRSLQAELRRVGCNTGAVDGNWNAASQRSLDLFNKHAGMKLEVKVASVDALDVVKSKTTRICPLICDDGFKADGERCTKITCRAGYEVGDDNNCEKIEVKKPSAKREQAKPELPDRRKVETAPSKPATSGQIICNQQGCRPLAKGCRIGSSTELARQSTGLPVEICN
jgi:chemotaxis protein histidine kinase CheA